MNANKSPNMKLYDKMFAEQEQYRAWLLRQSPEEILYHAYEYSVREDILFAVESTEFTDGQVEALLYSPAPLTDIYHIWEKCENDIMEEILSVIKGYANTLMQRDSSRIK